MNSFGVEKATTTRPPSTANLMVDSADRSTTTYPSWSDFQIVKPNALMNGYFTRIATTEVVLEWDTPNVKTGVITMDISGATTRSNVDAITYFDSFVTCADVINEIVSTTANGVTFAVTQSGNSLFITATGGKFRFLSTPLATQMGLPTTVNPQTTQQIFIGGQDLRRYRYIDFISPQITYAQDLKDNSTQPVPQDVLCRWYMAEDVPSQLDQYGFPILMGYTPFVRRRLFNPPKQIKWDNNLPLGNISFRILDENGDLVDDSSEFLMTLQITEN